ncbi:hypothetical protein KJ870_07110 [bacterium]|nr:hypothetical protein [bacterium]MBU1434688.1 hypothetical protein [bacterium]MBU1502676.1 hypothetical protein [bacterium]
MKEIKLISILLIGGIFFSGCDMDKNETLSYKDIEVAKSMYNNLKLQYELINEINNTYYAEYNQSNINTKNDMNEIQYILSNNDIFYPKQTLGFKEFDLEYMNNYYSYFSVFSDSLYYEFEDWYDDLKYSITDSYEVGCKVSIMTYIKADNSILETSNNYLNSIYSNAKNNSLDMYEIFDYKLKDIGFSDGCCSLNEKYCLENLN